MKRLITLTLCLTMLCLMATGCSLIMRETSVADDVPSPVVTIEMEDGGVITLELYPKIAPNTVANFVNLIEENFYDGLIFHRIIPHFMIQGGDPLGTGMGGPGYAIKGEFAQNNFTQNDLKHTRGVISMARAQDPDSAGSQFFIMHADADYLDGGYAAFGKVIEGMDVVDQIANISHDAADRPLELRAATIKTMTVDTKGYQYTAVKIEEE